MTERFDFAVVGAGIAGASLAYNLGLLSRGSARTVLIEAERFPGYHTTGRSAAFWEPTYGGPGIVPLTMATRGFFAAPPPGFAERPLLGPRGALYIAAPGETGGLTRAVAEFAAAGVACEQLDAGAVARRFPIVRAEWGGTALLIADCHDIDVAALHAGFLAGARRSGSDLRCDARVEALSRVGDDWQVATTTGPITAGVVIDAAGAWGDDLAALAGVAPLGLAPLRRTLVVLDVDPPPPADLPVVFDAAGSFYFKPDAGRLWLSPHDEVPDVARDAAPEELDIAVAIDRFEHAATPRVARVERSWAGLRTFAPDRLPVYGFAADVAGFFWCVGQGGFGIQTAPAAGELAARLVLGLPAGIVDPAAYSPERFADAGR